MKEEVSLSKKQKKKFSSFFKFFLQSIIVISLPLFINTNSTNNDFFPNNGLVLNDCSYAKYLEEKCQMNFQNDEDKMLLKTDFIFMVQNGTLDVLMNEILNNDREVLIREESEAYQIFKVENQKYHENITYIDFAQCIYNIYLNNLVFSDLLIFKIDHYLTSYKIPLVEYIIFDQFGQIFYCENIMLQYNVPVTGINASKLYLFNISSDYYKDECSQFKSENGTDITLYSRKYDFDTYNISLCEVNCTFKGFDPNTVRAICECKARVAFYPQSGLDKSNLIPKFEAEPQITNFYVFNCYYLISSSEDIKANPGFYLTLFILVFFVIIFFVFLFKGYSALSNRIDEAIKMKFNPNKKENEKNDKLIIIKINNKVSSKNNNKIKRTSKKSKTNNKISKNEDKRLNRKKSVSNSKNMSLESNNNFMFGKKGENGENKAHKTNAEDNTEEANNEGVYIFENDYEINTLPFEQAVKCDKRTTYEFYVSLIRNKQLILFSFFDFNSYNSCIVNKTIFFLSFIYHYGFNAFFFTDEVMHKIYENEGAYDPETLVPNSLFSAIISTVLIRLMTEFLILTEKNVLKVKNQNTEDKAKEEKAKVLKIICIKFIIFFVLNFLLLFFFWFYLTCFNAVFPNTQTFLMINTIISFVMSNIYPLLYNLIPAFFRSDIMNSEEPKGKKKAKVKPKTETEKKDAEYVYSVAQMLQKI